MQDSQTLDCTFFGPLKHHWSNVCHKYLQNHAGAIISKYNFCEFFTETWLLALTPSNVVSGFYKCGIHPFNPNTILSQGGGFEVSDTEILPEKQGDDCSDNADQIDISAQNDCPIATSTSAHALSSPPQTQQSKFSEDKVAFFERRYEEG